MRRPLVLLVVLLLIGATHSACKRKPSIPPDVVVRVGERMLTLGDFKRYVERNAGTELAQITPEVASAMLDQYVEEVVLAEIAASRGVEIPTDKLTEAVRHEAGATVVEKRDEMRRQRLLADISAEVPEPRDEEVRAYYAQNQGEFRSSEEVRVRQILVRDEKLAGDIARRLAKGEPFEDLSAEFSLAPNAKKGGDIGYVSRGELPTMFEEVIFSLQPGGVSEVIRTDTSFHIFKVEGRRPAGPIDLDSAAPVIRQRLREDGIRERIAQLVSRSKTDFPIAVLTKRLPFKYSGTLPKSENE